MNTHKTWARLNRCCFSSMILMILLCIGCKTDSGPAVIDKASAQPIQPVAEKEVSLDSAVNFLLNAAAGDFQKNQLSLPVKFRNMKVGHIVKADGEKQYIMCGEFLPKDKEEKNEWISFATIRTMDYEQWIGNQSVTFCEDKSVKWEKGGDLASELINRLTKK